MGITERQKNDLKNVLDEFFSDKTFFDTFAVKVADIVSQKMMVHIEKLDTRISALEKHMNNIQGDNEELRMKVDTLEQQSKCNQLRVFGVPEDGNENVKEKLLDIFENKINVNDCQLENCYRLGPFNRTAKYPRPILATFINEQHRNKIFQNKKNLKGSRIAITEELTKIRYELLILSKDKYGKGNVWTYDGNIYTNINGKKHRIRNTEDLN